MKDFLPLAHKLADAAGAVIRGHFRQRVDIIGKDDASPVTIADREAELAIRAVLEKERPQDGIFGEEFGRSEGSSGLCWVIDPIDGTKAFMTGRPTFGTLIALCEDGVPVLGVIDQPVVKDRWIGGRGVPCEHNGRKVNTRACVALSAATCSLNSMMMFRHYGYDFLEALRDKARYLVWGGDCTSYGLLADGWSDVILEANMEPFDFLAQVPIVESAGGWMRDFNGDVLTIDSGDAVVALGDQALWPEVRKILDQRAAV